jgi:hypothetical protein
MSIYFTFANTRTIGLLGCLIIAIGLKIATFHNENEIRQFSVVIYADRELTPSIHHLMNDLLPRAEKLRLGKPVPYDEGFVGHYREDPRSLLFFLWDYLTPSQRSAAMTSLGYPQAAPPSVLNTGPHPSWFSECGADWLGTFEVLWRCSCGGPNHALNPDAASTSSPLPHAQ